MIRNKLRMIFTVGHANLFQQGIQPGNFKPSKTVMLSHDVVNEFFQRCRLKVWLFRLGVEAQVSSSLHVFEFYAGDSARIGQ